MIRCRLYGAFGPVREKLVTQKVRLRLINGEESHAFERLLNHARERKDYPADTDYEIESFVSS